MDFEKEVFKRGKLCYEQLIPYGFEKKDDVYVYRTSFFKQQFDAVITISKKGDVVGVVTDHETGDVYAPLRMESSQGAFVGRVREEYVSILMDIFTSCFSKTDFAFPQTNRIAQILWKKYQGAPEFLWEDTPGCGVFRNQKTKKWYAIIMELDYSKLDDTHSGKVEIMNVKIEPDSLSGLLKQKGVFEAYHMNKKNWITFVLDDTLTDDEISRLIDQSYRLVS